MGIVGKLVCKTVGIAGMSAVVYDAYSVGKHHLHSHSQAEVADSFEKTVAASRTTTEESPLSGTMQKKVADLRMSNPIVPAVGKFKGFVSGFFNSLGDNIVPVTFSAIALAAKGRFAKLGAWGVAGFGIYKILKEGLGIGKHSAVDN